MHIVSLALGGCIKAPPVDYGLTEDTGGHIAYILGEMSALARHPRVTKAEIITRRFDEPTLGSVYARAREVLPCGTVITRIDSGNRRYLSKEALFADRQAFVEALVAELQSRDRLPDLIHAHFADAADIACQVRERLGIPFVYTAHSLAIDKLDAMGGEPDESLRQRIAEEQRAIDCADAVVASSRDECERQLLRYEGVDPTRIHRLRPGIDGPHRDLDLGVATELVFPFLKDMDKPIVLAIARPVQKKNLARLVEAFAANAELRDRANLVILAGLRNGLISGEAEQRQVLTGIVDAIDRHNLYGKVAYPPRHTRQQVQSLYALARDSGGVFVNPALTEPYGLTLIEAAAHGLPVVATRNGGPNDIVEELENGVLIDPCDTQDIGAAILRMLNDRQAWKLASQNARTNVRSMSWDAYATGFVELAREILVPDIRTKAVPRARQLLVCDIDNTLTGCSDGARRFARHINRQTGTSFCIATGRSLVEARRILREWELPQPNVLITSVGSEIYWNTPHGLRRDDDYSAAIGPGWQPDRVSKLLDSVEGLVPQVDVEQRRWKRSYFIDRREVADEVRRILRDAGCAARVIVSHRRLLDVLPVKAGKGAAMRHVAMKSGIALDRVVAVGDSGNDLDMLQQCRNAVLVRNYDEDLRELADEPGVYVATRPHAAGALEGHLRHIRTRRSSDAARRDAA